MGAIRIRCGELREHLYTEGYARCLESMSIDWDVGGNVKQLWEQVKLIMVDSRREVCSSVRLGGTNPENV